MPAPELGITSTHDEEDEVGRVFARVAHSSNPDVLGVGDRAVSLVFAVVCCGHTGASTEPGE